MEKVKKWLWGQLQYNKKDCIILLATIAVSVLVGIILGVLNTVC